MRNRLVTAIILSTLLLVGCSEKTSVLTQPTTGSKNVTTSGQASINDGSKEAALIQQRVEINTNLKPIEPNTTPQLSSKQKSQVNSKINTTLKSIDETLKALEDMPEIDLSSLEK
jgi:uncharacterized protein YcfL